MSISTEDQKTLSDSGKTNDSDLVELAGYHAYVVKNLDRKIKVNGKDFEVLNVLNDPDTGLDAMTVQNKGTGEVSVVYVGTDTNSAEDIITDLHLVNSTPPLQLEEGLNYFNDMEKEYGEIRSIAGNSLGGATANYVGVNRPDVKTVTLNTALLPSGVVNPNASYDNITNYMSQYDVLTRGLKAMGYGDRIPGHHFEINNGIPSIDAFATNHTGYLKENINEQFYPVGNGEIYIDADSHIMTSIWTGIPLYYGDSEPVQINVETLYQLADGIKNEVHSRVILAQTYVKNALEIVVAEGEQYTKRVNQLQDQFKTMIEGEIGNTVFKGITTTNSFIQQQLDVLIALTHTIERRCESLNLILNSPPAELLEFITRTNVDVSTIFSSIRKQLWEFKAIINALSKGFDQKLRSEVIDLFRGGTEMWLDAVVREMQAHFNIVDGNKDLFEKHVGQYQQQVHTTADNFKKMDEKLGDEITNKTNIDVEPLTGQDMETFKLVESPYLALTLRMKEAQVNAGYDKIQMFSSVIINPLITALAGIVTVVEGLLASAVGTIKGSLSFVMNWTLPGILIKTFSNFDEKIRDRVDQALQPIEEMLEIIDSLRVGLTRLQSRLPAVVRSLKPYIDSALFSKSAFHNVHLYNTAAVSLYKDMDLLFSDIVTQLSNHKAKAITALKEESQSVKDNMFLLREQVELGTI